MNASRLPSTFNSPDVIACSIVISFNWMRSNVVFVSVILHQRSANGFLK